MRREAIITISDDGRDAGKVFCIREMSAAQGERWAMRAFMVMAKSGIDVPDDPQGMADLARVGIKGFALAKFEEIEPLLIEMMACVRVMPDSNNPNVKRDLIDTDTEEISTRLKLRKEVLALHLDFFTNAAP